MLSLFLALLASLAAHKVLGQFAFHEVLNATYFSYEQVQANPSIVPPAQGTAQDTATELVKMTMPNATFRLVDDHYVGANGIAHFYFRQTANDVDIDNADFNVNIGRDGEVFSFGHSFLKAEIKLQKRSSVDPVDALKTAVKTLELPISTEKTTSEEMNETVFKLKGVTGTMSDPEARLVYFRVAHDELALAWRIETDINTKWLVTYVDAEDGETIHHVVDYGSAATYEVYPFSGVPSPAEGSRTVVKDPWDSRASEFGWHGDGTSTYNTTRGNNAIAHSNWDGTEDESAFISLPRPTSDSLTFEYPYSPDEEDYKSYVNASITQAFYTVNKYHDLMYLLGFHEAAGNFQLNNNGKGGKDGDWIYVNVQDGGGTNNANFMTAPDGQPGRCVLYMGTLTEPWRDSAFATSILLHELTHGVAGRLTGGPANTGCLEPWEPGAMNEGVADWYAQVIGLKADDTRDDTYPMTSWDTGDDGPNGIREHPLSTNMTVNALVYEDANTIPIMHWVGTVWATMLWEVLWDLIDLYGKNDDDVPRFDDSGVPTDGKYLAMKLVTDGMAMMPCNPSFIQGRDAIVDADQALTGGKHRCLIWKSFARRGLGTGAILYDWKNRTGSFELPGNC